MAKKPKRITRKFYTDKFRPEIAAVIQEILVKEKTLFPMLRSVRSALQSAHRLSISDKDSIRSIAQLARELEKYQKEYDNYSSDDSIENIDKIVSSVSDDPTQLNHAYKKLLAIVADLLFDLHQEYRTYTSNQRYAPIVKKLMEELRDEDEKDKWDDIYRKQLDELQNVRDDARERYYELVEMIKAITYTIREIYKEEERKMIEQEKKFSAEECVTHQDEIRRAIYEKCASGEITLERREELLQNLNSMVLSESTVEDVFNEAMNNYLEDVTTEEEFDQVLTSIYEDHPAFAERILDEPVGRLYDMFHENVNDLYHDGLLSLEEAKYRSALFEDLFKEEYKATYLTEEPEGLDKVQSLRDAYYDMLEAATDALNSGALSLEEFDSEIGKYADLYYRESASVLGHTPKCDYSTFLENLITEARGISDNDSVYTEDAVETGLLITALVMIAAIPIGLVIDSKMRGRTAKKLSNVYESTYKPAVKWKDLSVESVSIERLAELDPSIAKAIQDPLVRGEGSLATYKGKPFMSVAVTAVTSYTTSSNGVATSSYGHRTHIKDYTAEAKKHYDYYASMLLITRIGVMRPELKRFVTKLLKEAKIKEKQQKAAKKFTKESAIDVHKVQALKESAEARIRRKYEAGEISIDQREELLMQLHTESVEEFANRFFFDSNEINPYYERGKISRNKKGFEPLQELQRKAKEALQNYEIDRKPKIRIKDLKLSGVSIKEAAKLNDRIDLNSDPKQSVCGLLSYNGKPIVLVTITKPKNKPDANGMLMVTTYGEEGSKHQSYYKTAAYVYLLTPIDHPDIRIALTNFVKKYGNSTMNFLKYTIREDWKSQFTRPNSKKRTDDDTSDYTEASSSNMYIDLLKFAVSDTEQRMRKNYLKNNPKEAKRIKTAKRLAKQKERQHVRYVNRFDKYLDTITDIKKLRDMKYDYPYDGIERKRIDIRIKELEKEKKDV